MKIISSGDTDVFSTMLSRMGENKPTYSAYRYPGGSTEGVKLGTFDDAEKAFDTAEMDAKAIMDALKARLADESIKPRHKPQPCRMVSDEGYNTVEIRQEGDGYLMYYFDVVENQ